MFDIKWIRENPEILDQGLKRRGHEAAAATIINMDEQWRKVETQLQELQNERNSVAKQIGEAKQKGEDSTALMTLAVQIKEKVPKLEDEERQLKEHLHSYLSGLPNVPAADVPDGEDESANSVIRTQGEPAKFNFEPKLHYELGMVKGRMDFSTAAKISGSRFVVLYGVLARLERALARFMLDLHTQEFGYREVSLPLLVREQALFGTGQLPKFSEELFHTTDDRWLIPTAEVPLTNLVSDKLLDEVELPLRFVAHTDCFRSEAGAAGKDTRGMIRQHQFNKVELVSITHPEKSVEEHERMTGAAEEVLKRLKLPYRTMLLCSGDMGSAARKTYDLEVWLPGEARYREISSCSNCGDYQARRMNARFRPAHVDGKGKPQFVHTLNGSGLAVGRTLIAVLENYQQVEGSLMVPEVLVPYMNGKTVIQ